jgi:hypothetical protein
MDGYREMAKHPAKFIEACKRSKVDTDELAKQWLQDHKAQLADTQIAFGMRLQVVSLILLLLFNRHLVYFRPTSYVFYTSDNSLAELTEISFLVAVPDQREHGRRNRGTDPGAASCLRSIL